MRLQFWLLSLAFKSLVSYHLNLHNRESWCNVASMSTPNVCLFWHKTIFDSFWFWSNTRPRLACLNLTLVTFHKFEEWWSVSSSYEKRWFVSSTNFSFPCVIFAWPLQCPVNFLLARLHHLHELKQHRRSQDSFLALLPFVCHVFYSDLPWCHHHIFSVRPCKLLSPSFMEMWM